MKIRKDHCVIFEMRQKAIKSIQFQLKRIVNNDIIPPVKGDDSFLYFGRHFNLSMSNAMHIVELFEILEFLMSDMDKLPIRSNNKLLL